MDEKITFNFDSLLNNLPNFEARKEQEISYFINQFDELVKATKLPENLRVIILKTKIAGNAKKIFINTPDLANEQEYEELKTKLIETFQSTKSFNEAQHKFLNIKQAPNQSIDEFIKHFNLTAQKYLNISGHANKEGAKDLLQSIKLTKFLEAIRQDISFEIQKNGPETIEQAITMARKIELALNNVKQEINAVHTVKESPILDALLKASQNQNDEMSKIKEQLNSLQIKNSKTNMEEKSPKQQNTIYCHICKKDNHSTETCFYNKKAQNNSQFPREQHRNRFNNNYQRFNQRSKNYFPRFRNPNYNQTQLPTPPQFLNYQQNPPPHNSQYNSFLPNWGYSNQQYQPPPHSIP